MKTYLAMTCLLALSFSLTANASWRSDTKKTLKEYKNECRTTEVTVDSIVKNESIQGHIKGLPQDAYSKFKVVFYVKTNRWYVHPYQFQNGQDQGLSYANLKSNGTFSVKTVRRDVPSKQMVAVLVPKDYKIKSQRLFLKPFLGFIGGILKYECAHTLVQGNGDFL